MIIPYLLLWIALLLFFRYTLKQNNETAVIRATLFTLIAYAIMDCTAVKEGLSKKKRKKRRRKRIEAKLAAAKADKSILKLTIPDDFKSSIKKRVKEINNNDKISKKKQKNRICRYLTQTKNININMFNNKLKAMYTFPRLSEDLILNTDDTDIIKPYNESYTKDDIIMLNNQFNNAYIATKLYDSKGCANN